MRRRGADKREIPRGPILSPLSPIHTQNKLNLHLPFFLTHMENRGGSGTVPREVFLPRRSGSFERLFFLSLAFVTASLESSNRRRARCATMWWCAKPLTTTFMALLKAQNP